MIADLPEIAGGWRVERIHVGQHDFKICRPTDPDALLDGATDENIPYWAYLWPTSYDLAAWILSTDWQPPGEVLELGCGIGLVGLAGLAAGWQVTLSDYEPFAVQVALANARLNGFTNAPGSVLDWREEPPQQYAAIVGCDVTYERTDHEPLLNFLDTALLPDGTAWLADCNRAATEEFLTTARERGYDIRRNELPAVDFSNRPKSTSVLRRLTRRG
ncbi:ribosomal protein L11 methyltransferase [Symmachiella macrocystis]|uniref:Ribosomal protein L11 methyltransferase n=1 Tax=Symmachiella macrocystis TaxID=2527985 RepID=A0A5C6B6S0_9PLAN|nr:methyltransferase [Symmachiella macrocystis]TWU07221.1 ribosomal protein L11 methyltransferase [Symmachiella macrocystis]